MENLIMCSTPRPKAKVKAKNQVKVVSILANLTSEQRLQFAQRSNITCEKRQQIQQQKLAENKRILARRNKKMLIKKDWQYWFLNASVSEIFRKVLFGHS